MFQNYYKNSNKNCENISTKLNINFLKEIYIAYKKHKFKNSRNKLQELI